MVGAKIYKYVKKKFINILSKIKYYLYSYDLIINLVIELLLNYTCY